MVKEGVNQYLKKILIIEDDPTLGKGIRLILRSEQYEITLKDNSPDALAIIKKSKPDLIITDLFLDEINGLEIYELYHKTIPTLIITGSVDTKLAHKAKQVAGTAFIKKPFLPEIFKNKVDEIFKKKK